MIEPYSACHTYPYYRAADIIPVIQEEKPGRIAVLFSGDTGFSSGAPRLRNELSAWFEEKEYEYEIITIPGISSIAYFSARAGIDYTDSLYYEKLKNITAKDISLFIDRLVLDTTYFLREDYNE